MKTFTINIPTNKHELKDCFMHLFSWLTHTGRMKRNSKIMDKLFENIYSEINSGYWSKDISEYMKRELTNPINGKISKLINDARRKLI